MCSGTLWSSPYLLSHHNNWEGAGKRLQAGHWEKRSRKCPPQAQQRRAFRRVDTHSLPAALAVETGRGKRPTQSSPGGWAAAPSRPFSSSPPQQRSGCHFETSGAVPLRPGPPGHSTDGPIMDIHAVPRPMAQHKKTAFHSLEAPRQFWNGGATPPPHILSSLQCCCTAARASSPPTLRPSNQPSTGNHSCSQWEAEHRQPPGPLSLQKASLDAPRHTGLPLADHPCPQPLIQLVHHSPLQGSSNRPSHFPKPHPRQKLPEAQHSSADSASPQGQQYVGRLTTSTSPHPFSSHHLPWPWKQLQTSTPPHSLLLPRLPTHQQALETGEHIPREWNFPEMLEAWLLP